MPTALELSHPLLMQHSVSATLFGVCWVTRKSLLSACAPAHPASIPGRWAFTPGPRLGLLWNGWPRLPVGLALPYYLGHLARPSCLHCGCSPDSQNLPATNSLSSLPTVAFRFRTPLRGTLDHAVPIADRRNLRCWRSRFNAVVRLVQHPHPESGQDSVQLGLLCADNAVCQCCLAARHIHPGKPGAGDCIAFESTGQADCHRMSACNALYVVFARPQGWNPGLNQHSARRSPPCIPAAGRPLGVTTAVRFFAALSSCRTCTLWLLPEISTHARWPSPVGALPCSCCLIKSCRSPILWPFAPERADHSEFSPAWAWRRGPTG